MDPRIKTLSDTPHTISYVIRKRQQLDNLSELPKTKRPDDETIWDGTPEDMEDWLNRVFDDKTKTTTDIIFTDKDIEE